MAFDPRISEGTTPYEPTEDEKVIFVGELDDVEPGYLKRWEDSRRNPVIEDMSDIAYEILNDPASAGDIPQESPETIGQSSGKGPSRGLEVQPEPQKLPYLDDERTREFIVKQVMAGESGEEISKLFGPGVEETFLDPVPMFSDLASGGLPALLKLFGKEPLMRLAARLLQGRTIGKNIIYEVGIGQEMNLASAGIDEVIDSPALSALAMMVGIPAALALGAGGFMAISKNIMRARQARPDLAKKMMEIGREFPESNLGKAVLEIEAAEAAGPSGNGGEAVAKLMQDIGTQKQGLQAKLTTSSRYRGVPTVEMSPENIARFQEIAGEPTMMGNVSKRGPIVSWSGETTDKAANINFNYINSPDDIKQALSAISEIFPKELDEARRGTVTFAETRRLADALGMSVDDLLKRQRGQAFNDAQAYAARTLMENSAAVLVDLMKKAADPAADMLTQLEFRKQLNLHYAIEAQVTGMAAEAGRALNQFKMVTSESKRNMQYLHDLMKALPDSAGMSTAELARYLSQIENPEGLNKMVSNLRNVTSFNMFLEYWINSLLSGPQTHVVNTLSNTLMSLWVLGEKGIAAGLGATVGRNNFGGGSFAHNAYGVVEGFKDGLKVAMRSLKTGEATDLGTKMELPGREPAITAKHLQDLFDDTKLSGMTGRALAQGGPVARAVDLMGEIVRTPTRLLQAEDELFKSVGYRMHLRGEAYRRASQEGLTGNSRAARMAQIMNDPELHAPDISLGAINAARYQTFTSELGPAGKDFMEILREIPALRLIVPFVRTPANIMKFAFERTPGLGLLSKRMREDWAAGGARRDLAIAKQALGGLTMTVGTTLAAQGMITGGGPVDSSERANLMRTGWKPYSLKIGDKYISYNRAEPMGMLLGAAADFAEISGLAGEELQPELDDLAAAILMAVSKNATSKTWLQGVSNAIEAIEDPKRYGSNYIERIAGTLVPTLSAQFERTVSPEVEEINGMIEALKARTPGLSKDLKPRRDLWGETITRSIVPTEERGWATMAFEAINPFYISSDTHSPIDKEMVRLRTHIERPGKVQSIQGIPVELTFDEMDRFEELISRVRLNSTGKGIKASLNYMVQHDSAYKQRSDELKDAMIRAKMTEARELARQKLYEESPEIRALVEQGRAKKQRSMQ